MSDKNKPVKPIKWGKIREFAIAYIHSEIQNISPHYILSNSLDIIYYEDGKFIQDQKDKWLTKNTITILSSHYAINTESTNDNGEHIWDIIPAPPGSFTLFNRLESQQVEKIVKKYKQHLMMDKMKDASEFNTFCLKMENPSKGYAMILINVLNGVVRKNLGTNDIDLLDNHPNNFFRSQLNVNYDEKSECKIWEEKLPGIIPDKQDLELFRYFSAYSLLPFNFNWEVALYCWDTGRNGKSKVVGILATMFEKTAHRKISDMTYQFSKQSLLGYDFWWANESDKFKIDTSAIKNIISGENFTIDRKQKDSIDTIVKLKLIITSNTIPNLQGYADKRRFLVIRFPNKFTKNDDLGLGDKFELELPGIFNWVLSYIPKLLSNLNELKCDVSNRWDQFYELHSDPFLQFSERYIINDETQDEIDLDEIVKYYNLWADNDGYD